MMRYCAIILIISTAFILGCGEGTYTPVQTLTSIGVFPSSIILKVGSVESFTARGYDQNSNEMSISPVWTLTGTSGAISSSGVFTALSTGDCTVKASSGSIYGTASITVSGSSETQKLKTITVTPAYASLTVGESMTFVAAGFDESGTPMAISPAWIVIGSYGTVTSSGLFTAMFEGVCMVQASQGTISGGAVVSIKENPYPF